MSRELYPCLPQSREKTYRPRELRIFLKNCLRRGEYPFVFKYVTLVSNFCHVFAPWRHLSLWFSLLWTPVNSFWNHVLSSSNALDRAPQSVESMSVRMNTRPWVKCSAVDDHPLVTGPYPPTRILWRQPVVKGNHHLPHQANSSKPSPRRAGPTHTWLTHHHVSGTKHSSWYALFLNQRLLSEWTFEL